MENLIEQLESISLNLIRSSLKKKDGTESFLLVDDSFYEYKVSYQSNNGKITWRCNNTNYPNCPGAVSTQGNNKPITVVRGHDHNRTIKTKVKEVTAQMRQMAENQPDTKPRKIILECQKNVSVEVAANLPSYNAARLVLGGVKTKSANQGISFNKTVEEIREISIKEGLINYFMVYFPEEKIIKINQNQNMTQIRELVLFKKSILNDEED
ncbi:unnamed protein product [Brachionus calyciflorus]|uniref:FLYWCH-type domain-containing protein n=1 Tax=Brachionus calyciflorus TaxID=104777 RepID=A0A813VKC3_9BILA|nr:unnamed protein product [Brachionus calyciflorus]